MIMRLLVFAALLAAFANSASAGVVYYVDLINTSPSDIVSFKVAAAGTDRFHSILLGDRPLQGGGASATVGIREGDDGCKRDLRIGFADGRVLTHRGFNVCKYASYHTDHYLHGLPNAQVTVTKPGEVESGGP
jgi:hypothetical protein